MAAALVGLGAALYLALYQWGLFADVWEPFFGPAAALGLWLMAAPGVLGYGGAAATNDHILGPLAAGCSIIALGDIARGLRWLDVGLGAWLVVGPWFLGVGAVRGVQDVVIGLLLIGLPFLGGRAAARFGGWSAPWRALRGRTRRRAGAS